MTSLTLEEQTFAPASLEVTSVGELVELRDQYDEELVKLGESMDEAFVHLSDKDKNLINDIEEEYVQIDEKSRQAVSLVTILEGYGFPDEVVTFMKRFDAVQAELERVNQQLDRDHGGILARYVIDEAELLLKTLDLKSFNKLKSRAISLPDEDGIELPLFSMNLQETHRRVIGIIERLSESIAENEPSFSIAESDLQKVMVARQIFEKWGVISESVDSVNQAARIDAEIAGKYAKSGLLSEKYRTNYSWLDADPEMEPEANSLPIYEWGINLSIDQMGKLRTHIQSTDKEKELARLRIEGVEKTSFGIDEAAIREHIDKVIPAIALEGVEKIVFKRKDGTESDSQEAAGWTTLAHHVHDQYKNSAEIVIWLDPLEAKSKATDEMTVQKDFFRTFDHEFGHALCTVLPTEFLRYWHEQVEKDEASISDYVSYRHRSNHRYRYAEDFAESFSMFINSTDELFSKSARRFWGMYDLFGLTVKGQQRVSEFQQAKGRLPEALDVNFDSVS